MTDFNFTGGNTGAAAKPRTTMIYLKGPLALRGDERGQKFEPVTRASTKCSCNATLFFYCTLKNEKPMPFDREPRIFSQYVREDGAIIAEVFSDDSHFASCADLKRARTTQGFSATP